jgi:hypothetical protein
MNQKNKTFVKQGLTTIILFVMLLSVGTSGVYCATAKDLVIEYDFATGSVTPKKGVTKVIRFTVTKGKSVIFKIINFNRFSYKATITADSVVHNFNANTPSQFSDLISGEEEAKKKAVKVDPKKKKGAPKPVDPIKQLSSAIKNLEKIKKLQADLEHALYKASSFHDLKTQKDILLFEFLAEKPFDKNHIETEAIKRCLELRNDAIKTFDDITNKEIARLGENGQKLLKDLEELSKLKSLKEIEKKLKSIDKEEYKKVFEKYAKDGKFWLTLSRKLSQLENMMKEFKEKKYVDGIKKILANINQDNFEVSLTVPTVDADEIKFNVAIEPIDKKKAQVYHQLKSPVVVKVKGGWLLDFSAGVLFQFDAHEEVYRFDESPGDKETVTLRLDTHKHSMTPVLGALMHIYPRQTGKLKWVFTFGAGIGEAENLSYYGGLGLMVGSKRRFVISVGAAVVKYARLLPEYREFVGNEMPKNEDLTADDVVRASYKLRAFVSFTYNL